MIITYEYLFKNIKETCYIQSFASDVGILNPFVSGLI